ncbi:hypothetical protein EVAR_45925_1 [Eumeta japonica]|uniref:Uncharacterized protein n=1 Tax=Eumeta variegata TaxID=151549 RepID=A0A4C1W8N6_EUMVA|nr:hypothetical protein EVAR_45925_1 [Eumeta japonica]
MVGSAFVEAEKRLKELEKEKQRLDAELRAAQQKISRTETNANALQLQLREMSPLLRNGERARRAISFVPTAKSSSDTLIDVRGANLRNFKLNREEQNI